MRLDCPICGRRDRREFHYLGDAVALERPAEACWSEAWHAYLHLRENPAGARQELWWHEAGCGAWLVVTRDSTRHEVLAVRVADDSGGAGQ